MSNLDRDSLQQLCRLCRIEASSEELAQLEEELPKILDYVARLGEVETESVQPCSHAIGGLATPLREDEPGELYDQGDFLAASPAHTAGMVRVPPVIKQQD